MQGTVMKITNEQIVVLCDDGMYRNQPLQEPLPALGERITVQPQSIQEKVRTWHHTRRWAAVALIGLFVMLSYMLLESSFSSRTAAMIAIDINPSIEVLVNRKGTIEKLVNFSEDAEALVSADQLVHMDVYDAVHFLISQAESQGLINQSSHDTLVLLSVVSINNAQFQIDLSKFNEMSQYDIELFYVTNEEKEQAQTAQLTLNKYHVYQQGREMGIEWQVEDLRQKSIVDSLIDSGWEPQTFFEQARQREVDDVNEVQQNEEPVATQQSITINQVNTKDKASNKDKANNKKSKNGITSKNNKNNSNNKSKSNSNNKGHNNLNNAHKSGNAKAIEAANKSKDGSKHKASKSKHDRRTDTEQSFREAKKNDRAVQRQGGIKGKDNSKKSHQGKNSKEQTMDRGSNSNKHKEKIGRNNPRHDDKNKGKRQQKDKRQK